MFAEVKEFMWSVSQGWSFQRRLGLAEKAKNEVEIAGERFDRTQVRFTMTFSIHRLKK